MNPAQPSSAGVVNRRAAAAVIGGSAGSVEALSAILPQLPAGYSLPILVVVHLPPDQKSLLPELFRAKCRVEVREPDDKEPIVEGTIYFAPPDYHLLVESDGRLSVSSEEPVRFSRPSIDVLFESAAEAYGPQLVGVVLTGGNDDGARGLLAIQQAGGTPLVQRPDLADNSTMPQAALALCPGAQALTLEEIVAYLIDAARPCPSCR